MRGFILALTQWLDRIHQGDCLELMKQLPDGCVDLVFTSPPYNIRNSTGGGRRQWNGYEGHSDDMPHDDYVAWQRECLAEMLRLIPETGAIFYQHCHRVQNGIMQSPLDILGGFPYRQAIIWEREGGRNHNPGYFLPTHEMIYMIAKPRFQLTDRSAGTVWKIAQERDAWIPEIPCFPVALPRQAIRATSARVVLDPFIGSGTTAEAAVHEGRSYIGIEKSPAYCEIARRRLGDVDPNNGTSVMPLQEVQPFSLDNLPARGSARAVFQYIRNAVAKAGWKPTTLSQGQIAERLDVHRNTVVRAIAALESCGAIKVVDHGRWTEYELQNPPRTGATSAQNPPRTGATSGVNPPRTGATSGVNPPGLVLHRA